MIYGIGHDIVENNRIKQSLEQYGDKFIQKILTPLEQELITHKKDKVRYLAKRFAAKEAFAKACGTGLRDPILLQSISIVNDELGKPYFKFSVEIEKWLIHNQINHFHLSISDEINLSSAFVILEK
ncbi:MAG: holo-ACP synthase [Burkholderiales bacterium]|nr:holo-ACP synthase [Burkholderiales bacterium]